MRETVPCPICFDPVNTAGGYCPECGSPLPPGWEAEFLDAITEKARVAAKARKGKE